MALRSEAAAVRYALPEAAGEASLPLAAPAVLRAQAGAAAAALLWVAAAGAALLWAAAAEVARRAGAAAVVPRPAALDVQRAEQPSAPPWVCHPDQTRSAPGLPPAERFARAMQAPRIALP